MNLFSPRRIGSFVLAALTTSIACSEDPAENTGQTRGQPGIQVQLPAALGGGTAMTQLAPSTDPAKRHRYGAPLPTPGMVSSPADLQDAALSTMSLPDSIDISTGTPPIGDQSATASCQSWAAGYTAMGWWANKVGVANAQFAPMYLYSQIDKGSCNTPLNAVDALAILKAQGIDTLSDYQPMQQQLDCATQPSSAQQINAGHFKITGYSQIDLAGGAQRAIMTTLAAGHPVLISFTAYAEFENADSANYLVGPPKTGDTSYGGHVVTGLRYDKNGVWIANSWGTDWGNSGWAILSWDLVNGTFSGGANVWAVSTITGVKFTCSDMNPQCAAWAASSQCQENPDYMLPNCCASCANPSLAFQSYKFHPLTNTSSCLDVQGGKTADYTAFDEYACNGTPAQSFNVLNAGGGLANLYHPHSGRCLDIKLGGVTNGTPADIYDCNGTGAQLFQVQNNGDGTVTFHNPQSGKCLDVSGSSSADGTKIQIWSCNSSIAQKWTAVAD